METTSVFLVTSVSITTEVLAATRVAPSTRVFNVTHVPYFTGVVLVTGGSYDYRCGMAICTGVVVIAPVVINRGVITITRALKTTWVINSMDVVIITEV